MSQNTVFIVSYFVKKSTPFQIGYFFVLRFPVQLDKTSRFWVVQKLKKR